MPKTKRKKPPKGKPADGNCFLVALDIFFDIYDVARTFPNFNENDLRLIHAEVMGQGEIEGLPIAHAWVELGDVAIDFSNENRVVASAELLRAVARINPDNIQSYTAEEVKQRMFAMRHCGPWDLDMTNVY